MDGVTQIDITVDGADEIDPLKRMIKGGGGALLREKIVAASSREMLVIIDEKKCVETLGAFPLPIEILPFGAASTIRRLQELLPHGSLRQRDGADYVSDNGNHIWDAQLPTGSIEVEPLHRELLQVPGVIDTGFFIGLAGRVIIGMTDGSVKILP
jgi:ribose 5-phosphate isomerase A